METGKTGKYFKYAIGEIILVVIGILIALQINNWNEDKKNQAFEKEILEQIQANLIKDKLTLETIKINFKKAIISTTNVLNTKGTKQEYDSIKYWLGDIVQFDRFQPLTNAYEVAKSKGLDLISNKQLRFVIGTYYDDEAKNVGKSIEDIEITFKRDWVPIMRKEVLEMKFKHYVILKEVNSLDEDSEIISLLRINKDNFDSGLKTIIKTIQQIEKTQQLISKELNH